MTNEYEDEEDTYDPDQEDPTQEELEYEEEKP